MGFDEMKIVKEMNKIALKLVGMAMVMLAVLQVGGIEVKADEEPNYLTFEALESSSVGFYIYMNVDGNRYVQYQKYAESRWEDWHTVDYTIEPATPETIDLNAGEKVRFR